MHKPITFLAILLLVGNMAFAQSTLTGTNSNPVIGESFTFNAFPASAFAQGDSGANITWTLFAGIAPTGTLASDAIDPTTLSQSSNFPSANLGFLDADLTQGFWIANQDSLSFLGGVEPTNNNLSVDYSTNPWTYLVFPLTYGDTLTDEFAGGTASSVGSPSTRTGEVTSIVDGHGDLVLPDGTVSGVLRLKTFATYRDTAVGFEAATYEETRYLWYAPGVHQPVAAMIRIKTFLFGTPGPDIVSVGYLGDLPTMGLTEPEALNSWQVFPNPANEQVQIAFDLEEGEQIHFSLMNAMGQTIEQQSSNYYPAGKHNYQMDLPTLPTGTYFLQLKTSDRVATQRLMIR